MQHLKREYCRPLMFVLCASSLDDALLSLNNRTQKQLKKSVHAIRGLSLNPFDTNARKTVQFYLNNSLKFQQVILWHDVSNLPSNNNRPLSPSELVENLLNYRHQILPVVYCQRRGIQDVYLDLQASGIVTISIVRDIISKRKAKNLALVKKYFALHQIPCFEIKTLTIIRHYSANLSVLVKKKLEKQLSNRRRRAKRNTRLSSENI